jgi:hypothetical protein
MRFVVSLAVLVGVLASISLAMPSPEPSWAQTGESTPPGGPSSAASGVQEWAKGFGRPAVWGSVVAAIIIVGGGLLLWRAGRAGLRPQPAPDPIILRLTPSFFFWLGMIYTGLLLLMAALYIQHVPSPGPTLLAGVLPIGVPWFGALGAVTISLEGVFLWNNQWERKYNYWHIGRPLFGAVLGIVAFFLFVVIGAAAGTPPKFLDVMTDVERAKIPFKDYIIFYVLAFLVGYREETFRELIKRATDLILKPGTPPGPAPAVTFKVGDAVQTEIRCPDTQAGQKSDPVTVVVENSGNARLVGPAVALTPITPTPANVFEIVNDLLTPSGELPAGQSKTVGVRFAPPADGGPEFTATLTVTGNLPEPKSIRVRGRRVV